jgi:hypothetical protein
MDQKTKPSFSVNMQAGPRTSRYGRQLPHYKGTISAPDSVIPQDIVLWSGEYQGQGGVVLTYFNGIVEPVSRSANAMTQIRARAAASEKAAPIAIGGKDGLKPIIVEDGRVVLFEAQHKDGTNIAANGKRRADVYGYWNNGGQLVQIGAYVNAQENRLASLVGKTQFPLSKEQLETTGGEMSQDDIEIMNRMADDVFAPEAHGLDAEADKKAGKRSGRSGR